MLGAGRGNVPTSHGSWEAGKCRRVQTERSLDDRLCVGQMLQVGGGGRTQRAAAAAVAAAAPATKDCRHLGDQSHVHIRVGGE